MFKFKLSLLLSVLLSLGALAQNRTLDSLRNLIDLHPNRDTSRVMLILDYVGSAVNENTTLLLPMLNEMISISREQNFKAGIQTGYVTAQIYYSDRSDMAKAMIYADSAFESFKGDTNRRAVINKAYLHHNVGSDYSKMGDFEQAVHHFTRAAEILEKYRSSVVGSVYNGIATVYEQMKEPAKAMEYNYKALDVAEKNGDKPTIARRRMGIITAHLSASHFKEADSLLKIVAPMVKETQDLYSMLMYHQSLGVVQENRKDYTHATVNLTKAYELARDNNAPYEEVTMLGPLTRVLTSAGNLTEAKRLLDTLLKKSIDGQMAFGQLSAYANIAGWYTAKGDFKTANDWLVKRSALQDSITTADMKNKVTMMETRYQVKGKDNEIKLLQVEKQNQELKIKQKEELNYILIGSAIALLIILILLYLNHHNKQKLQQQRITELETEKQLTATEAVLKGEEQERTRLAKDLHDGLGGMLSGIRHSFFTMKGNLVMTPDNQQAFERGIDMLDSSIREMRRVAHNMMPEVLVKYGLDTALRDFCIDINKSGALDVNYQSIGLDDTSIDQTTSIAIYRIAQELLNNSIRHAAASSAIVQLTKTDGRLTLTVEDDGKGFDPENLEKAEGIGWQNIRNRVDFLKGKIDIQSSPGKGSSVMIEVNI
ncbi:tetratricopeptide repeat-containing sensor histidine kinase [Pseudobacter ginsenosidimutans]|nr:sensor histidine kinase [Pseudobacter ginsenosidimutans]QEC44801.1 tetratricopeptide repeat protein [Pseudobacter ginsenosidimutans]